MKKKKTSKVKKIVRKKPSVKKKAKKPVKKKIVKKKISRPKVKKPSFGERVGTVTHYFDHVHAAVVKVTASKLRLGDNLRFKGHTTDFTLHLESMQMEHQPIPQAGKGEEIGVQVPSRVREGDQVYRIA